MKTMILLLAIAFAALNAEARAPKLEWCEAQRVVEMHNAVLAASLLCKQVITPDIYNKWTIKNRSRIKFANDIAVAYHMKKFGSRKHFDALDSETMNRNSKRSSMNPAWFCDRMKLIRDQMHSQSIDELLAKQNELEVPTCK